MNFWIIGDRNDGAVLDAYPLGGPEGWRYLESQRLASEFPENAVMGFSPRFPEKRKIYDFVTSTLSVRIVSRRVQQIALRLAPDDVEFLPVTLVNHQREVVSREHFIMNVISRMEVIDLEGSDIQMSAILKREIFSIERLTLKKNIPADGPKIFRPVSLRVKTMINAVLLQAFTEAGLTGCRFIPADGWDGDEDP